jgi:hypothetical protein
MTEGTLSCPAHGRSPPPIDGVDRVGDEWHLSVDVYSDMVAGITGVEPSSDLDLQALATITARLEGYVERERRQSANTQQSNEDEPASILSRVWRFLIDAIPFLDSTPETAQHPSTNPDYCVETVAHLARVFRAVSDARRAEIDKQSESTKQTADWEPVRIGSKELPPS